MRTRLTSWSVQNLNENRRMRPTEIGTFLLRGFARATTRCGPSEPLCNAAQPAACSSERNTLDCCRNYPFEKLDRHSSLLFMEADLRFQVIRYSLRKSPACLPPRNPISSAFSNNFHRYKPFKIAASAPRPNEYRRCCRPFALIEADDNNRHLESGAQASLQARRASQDVYVSDR